MNFLQQTLNFSDFFGKCAYYIKKNIVMGMLVALIGTQCRGAAEDDVADAVHLKYLIQRYEVASDIDRKEIEMFIDAEINTIANEQYGGNVTQFLDIINPSTRQTALMMAAQDGNIDVVNFLLQKGATVDLINPYGYTALMLAAHYAQPEVVTRLLAAGADKNIQNNDHKTALDIIKGCIANGGWEENAKRKGAVVIRILEGEKGTKPCAIS